MLTGPGEHLDVVTRTVAGLGHEVIARESSLTEVARLMATERPDVALAMVSDGTSHALAIIDRIVHEARCPVIAILHVQDRAFINQAAKRGSSPISSTALIPRSCRARSTSCSGASPNTTTWKAPSVAALSRSEPRAS